MNAMDTIVMWLVSAMLAWSPVDRVHYINEAKETAADATSRYNDIAKALVEVTYDPKRDPIFHSRKGKARAKTAMLLLSIAYYESGFRRDVDLGLGKMARGDFGNSHCMMQLNLGKDRQSTTILEKLIGQRWSANDVVQDRTKCFTAGYELVAKSFNVCKHLPFKERLAVYASGNCDEGRGESIVRVGRALRRYDAHVATVMDADVIQVWEQQHVAAMTNTTKTVAAAEIF